MSKLTEANKYLFGTENPKEVKKLFEALSEARNFDEDIVAGEPFYKYFSIWAKEVNKMMLKFNTMSLYRWMKSRRINTGMDLILRMYAETITENNPWPSKYIDVICSDFLDDIEDSIKKFCGKGLKHLCKLCGLESGMDSEQSLATLYAFDK